MDIGALRHRITIQTDGTPVPDGDGGYTQAPQVFATAWASITPATARDLERVVSGTVMASASHLIRLRYLSGVTTQMKVLFGSRTFSITGVMNPEERNRELVLTAVEVVT